jgi:glyoxylase-like metal-dependent hydrolase (beta-lactamase superfamily II)
MTEIRSDIRFIQGQDDMIPDSHVYVLGDPSGGDISLVDAGLMGKGPYKIESVKRMGIKLDDVKRIIMTHTHLDHIGCLPELMEQLPGVELWVHEEEAGPLEEGDERTVYGMDMFKNMCQAQYGLNEGAFKFSVDRKLKGGETIELGGTSWDVIHIPGHSVGGIGLYDSVRKILIPGDVVYADYAIGRFDLHGANGAQLKDSLMRLADLEVEVLLPAHNRIATELPAGYIRKTAEQWGPYLG